MNEKNFAVLGLGRFGSNVALTLEEMNCNVLGVDIDENVIEDLSDRLTNIISFDISDARAMREAGVANCDTVIIASKRLEASLMATMLCKEFGVGEIIVKAINERHAKMATELGASRIIFSERDTARTLALSLISPNVVDRIDIGANINILKLTVPQKIVGKNLIEANLRAKFDVNIVAIVTPTETLVTPPPEHVFAADEKIFIVGTPVALAKFERDVNV